MAALETADVPVRPETSMMRYTTGIRRAGRKLAQEPLGLAGFVILGLVVLIAIFALGQCASSSDRRTLGWH